MHRHGLCIIVFICMTNASKDFSLLIKELEEFNFTVVLIKRTINNDCTVVYR
jgi:hypothetical protein